MLENRPQSTLHFSSEIHSPVKIRSKYLVTNRYGFYILLSEAEYKSLVSNVLTPELFTRLETAKVIVTEKNCKKITEVIRQKNQNIFRGTSLHIVIPTLRCNHHCSYCHAASKPKDSKGYDMSREVAKNTVDFIFQTPSDSITIEFQGGEPLLNFPIVKYIIDYSQQKNKAAKKKLRFSLVTNLTLMNDKILSYLIKQKVGICTSLDGPKEVHDANRRFIDGSGSYDNVVKWVKKINAKDPILLNALTVVTKNSLPRYKEIINEFARLGFRRIWAKPMNFLGFAINRWEKIGYDSQDYVDFYKNSIDYIVANNIKVRDVFATLILKKIVLNEEPNFLDLQSPCGAAIGQLAYQYNGNIYSCDEGRMVPEDIFKLGTVTQTYNEVMTSSETRSLVCSSINDLYLCDVCAFKAYCGLCPVCNHMSQGTLLPKLATDMRCQILKGIFTYIFEKFLFEPDYKRIFETWLEQSKYEL